MQPAGVSTPVAGSRSSHVTAGGVVGEATYAVCESGLIRTEAGETSASPSMQALTGGAPPGLPVSDTQAVGPRVWVSAPLVWLRFRTAMALLVAEATYTLAPSGLTVAALAPFSAF